MCDSALGATAPIRSQDDPDIAFTWQEWLKEQVCDQKRGGKILIFTKKLHEKAGEMVKSVCFSYRKPEFSSRNPCWTSHSS